MKNRFAKIAAFMLGMSFFSPELFAGEKPFELELKKDAIIFGSGVLLSGGDLLLDNVLEFNRAEYKGDLYHKGNVNALDKAFMHSYSEKYDDAADYLLVATLATPAVLALTEKSEWLTVGVMYAETLLIANGIKEGLKLCINRARPYMFYIEDGKSVPEDDLKNGDWANSFPSGHTSVAFAGATFTTYTFCKYFPESKWKIPVGVASYGLAFGTSLLRMRSGNHFATDVLAGIAIGTSTGFLVPWLHTFNQNHDLNLSITPDSVSVVLKK